MAPHTRTLWPPIEEAYTDEFGPISEDVYECARGLWPRAEAFSLNTLNDGPAGMRLLLKACAQVTRARSEKLTQIDNLPAYLYRAFKRLVLERLEIEKGHRRLEAEFLPGPAAEESVSLEEKILIQQIMRLMDARTREVFELLLLGYTFEEIGEKYGRSANILRATYSKQIKRLVRRVNAQHRAAAERASWFKRLRGW
jgi:DNA-directed RNA polymerase specialized sigma24 family protein